MNFTLNIIDWQARAPGLCEAEQWQQWSRDSHAIDPAAPAAKLNELPMMTARRLSSGSKLAVECGLAMLRRHESRRRSLYQPSRRTRAQLSDPPRPGDGYLLWGIIKKLNPHGPPPPFSSRTKTLFHPCRN